MKFYRMNHFFPLLACLILASCFYSPEPEDNPLTGTWKNMNYNTGSWEKFIFRDDLTFTHSSYDGSTQSSSSYSGTYEISDTKIKFLPSYTTTKWVTLYLINDDKDELSLAFGDYWYIYLLQ